MLERESLELPLLQPFWALLEDPSFKRSIEELGGYDTTETGRRIR